MTVNRDAEILTGGFYVTVKDGRRTGFLLGPYDEWTDALGNVDRGRKLAQGANSRAAFYAYGTARLAPCFEQPATVFGR